MNSAAPAAPAAPPRTRKGGLDLLQLFLNGAGRIDRPVFLVALSCTAIAWRVLGAVPEGAARGLVSGSAGLLLLWSGCAVLSKRLHDLGLAGWWSAGVLALFWTATWGEAPSSPLQIAAATVMLSLAAVLAAWPGQPRFNRFGPSPREVAARP